MWRKAVWITVIAVLVATIGLSVGLGVGLTKDGGEKSSSAESINATLTNIAKQNNFPALGAGLFNGTFHETAVGLRKVGANVKVTTDDIWHFASNTKSMTATTIGLLIQDGLLEWNSTLGNLLRNNGLKIRSSYAGVKVQELSSHTSGISDRRLISNRDTLLAAYELNPAEGRVFVSNFTLSGAPVATQGMYEYSNMNYVLLGLIIDTVTGKNAEDVIRSRLWTPLGMATAGWGPGPESSMTSVDNPWPHIGNGALGKGGLPMPFPDTTALRFRDNPPCFYTAGGSHMSLADYARWLHVHFNSAVQARLNISETVVRKLHEIAPESGANLYTYGGWLRLNSGLGEGYSLQHDGSNTFNYATAIIEVLQSRAAIVVTNVAGQLDSDSNWVKGTHSVRDDLMSGRLKF